MYKKTQTTSPDARLNPRAVNMNRNEGGYKFKNLLYCRVMAMKRVKRESLRNFSN
jgi:hypothetical protein